MTDTSGQQNAEKSALETEKLVLDKRLLERQLSVQGRLIAWLQAASVPVALLGAILAFFVGFGQLRQVAENQAADRFDKALTRLASARPDERMTGISGLQLFLRDRNSLLQNQALQFLINGLSLETDTRVRGAILDVLSDLRPGSLSQTTLDQGLRTAVERDRSLTKSIVDDLPRRIARQKKQTLAKLKIPGLDLDGMGDEVPTQVIAALTTEQYLALLDADHGPFERLDPTENVPLIGLRTAIQTLVAQGATSDDFKEINCEDCNFSTAKSLDGVAFDGAYLVDADFAHVSLRQASFKNAELGGTNFLGADLTNADLRAGGLYGDLAIKDSWRELPLLECAKLGGADLSGQPLVVFVRQLGTGNSLTYNIRMPRMISVEFDASTKLDNFIILVGTTIADDYLKQHPAALEVQPLTTKRNDLYEDPLAESVFSSPDYQRIHSTYAAYTMMMMRFQVDEDGLKRAGKDAYMLRGFVDQPTLKELPLYSRFVDTVKSLSVPQSNAAKLAQEWSENAVNYKALATRKPLPCTEHPKTDRLLIDFIGSHLIADAPE